VDIRKVKKLIEMLEESKLSEIEIHEGEESVRISRHSTYSEIPQTVVHVPSTGVRQDSSPAQGTDGKRADTPKAAPEDGHYITAPMVGIFYSSPSPDKPPFVDYGGQVKVGDVVCIIEAMKIMNQIESDANGVISRVLVENGEPVEYGQPLFLVREG
jgi:acetyl-CoA carboxylase biotin carboxyl carrier protein